MVKIGSIARIRWILRVDLVILLADYLVPSDGVDKVSEYLKYGA